MVLIFLIDKKYGYENTKRFEMIGVFVRRLFWCNAYFTIEEVVRIW